MTFLKSRTLNLEKRIGNCIINEVIEMKLEHAFLGLLAASGIVTANVQAVKAEEGFAFKRVPVIVNGSGCPPGSAFGIVNGNSVSIIFSEMYTEAARREFKRASCNIRMKLDVPSGYTVQPVNLRYLGYANIPNVSGARSTLNTFASFGASGGWVDRSNFGPGFQSDFERNVDIALSAVNACTRPVTTNFGINTNISAWGPRSGDEVTSMGIDTVDVTLEDVIYRIEFGFIPCS
ncbi:MULTISPECIES: DUF4360 domain-containing protein [Cyanophyceae]|uniref:DUF4360 domain-containing protein n=2 Tax=Cyanophyceae TaxID=3028117 RepID=UPI00117E9816|nr:DUF4360 domain-containing protein [Picosynechococcus sp. PCC 7002]